MKIVILDGYSAQPGDLSWLGLENLGTLTVYDRTAPEQTVERAKDAEIVLTNKVVISKEVIAQLPLLKYVGVLATGYNVVDIEAARERGIVVTNVPAYSTESVAQMVFAHLLTVMNRTEHYALQNRHGRWSANPDFCYWDTELSKSETELPDGVSKVDLDTLLATSDVLSLHCPLTDSTRHLVNKETLSKMKSSAVIINTGRGPLVDDGAVANALESGRLYAFCADVLTNEPPSMSNPLLMQPNAYITPHIAWATKEARVRLIQVATDNVRCFLNGNPQNVVSS